MTGFVLLAAAMLALALAFVVLPLLRTRAAGTGAGANLTVLADAMRELDEDLAAGRIDALEHGRSGDALRRQALAADAMRQQQQERSRGANRDIDRLNSPGSSLRRARSPVAPNRTTTCGAASAST